MTKELPNRQSIRKKGWDDKIKAPSARRAVWCNQYVLAHCNRLVVGHLNPDGMLACILSEAAPELEISCL